MSTSENNCFLNDSRKTIITNRPKQDEDKNHQDTTKITNLGHSPND